MGEFGKNASKGSNDFMGVAPMHYRTAAYSFSDLTGSDQSLFTIGSRFREMYNLIGSQASKNNFLTEFSKFRIIQIYTHSSDTSERREPVMYFADSALYLSELIPQKTPVTQLIVLSACETGSGRMYKGEGIFSFNRGFAALGIPSAITNIWSVDDQATYQLSQLFYKYLTRGMPTDVALQQAKLEFVQKSSKERQLPYYWAAAILVGKTDSILMERTFPWKTLTLLTIFAGFSLFQVLSWLNRKKKISIMQ
jgi:CHAT domain-containing protein